MSSNHSYTKPISLLAFTYTLTTFCNTLLAGEITADNFIFAAQQRVISYSKQPVREGLHHHVAQVVSTAKADKQPWYIYSSPLLSEQGHKQLTDTLRQHGVTALESERFSVPGMPDKEYQTVILGRFASRSAAQQELHALPPLETPLQIGYAEYHPLSAMGTWHINVLEIEVNAFEGRLANRLAGNQVQGVETVLQLAERSEAIAAINANFFVMHEQDGVVGDPTGLLIENGRLLSEGLNHQPAVVIQNTPQLTAKLVYPLTDIRLSWDDGDISPVAGINRAAGKVRNCGIGDAQGSALAAHDKTCLRSNELVLLTREAGFEPGPDTLSVSINAQGQLSAFHPDSQSDDYILTATGNLRPYLQAKLKDKSTLTVAFNVSEENGQPMLSSDNIEALAAGPTLLYHGQASRREHIEGWQLSTSADHQRRLLVHRWINLRNPRTALGITAKGNILLVTVDGRQPGVSAGLSIEELRHLMLALGAYDGINLDGGGSTTMVINNQVVNSPSSHQNALRPVANALLVLSPPHAKVQ